MLSWNDYDVKCEQYADMRRAVVKDQLVREARMHQPQRRVMVWAWFGRRLGRSLVVWGARLEARYSN